MYSTAQGFIVQIGNAAAPFFNVHVYLSLTYFRIIKYNYRESLLRKRERLAIVGIWIFVLAPCAIAPLFAGIYNIGYQVCFINAYPLGCKKTAEYGEEANSIRGEKAGVWALSFIAILWIQVTAITIVLVLVLTIRAVARTERRVGRFQLSTRPGISDLEGQQQRT
jgi:hypothetical protein